MEDDAKWTLRELLEEYEVALNPGFFVCCLNCKERMLVGDLLVDEIMSESPGEGINESLSILAACPRCGSTTGFDRIEESPSEDES